MSNVQSAIESITLSYGRPKVAKPTPEQVKQAQSYMENRGYMANVSPKPHAKLAEWLHVRGELLRARNERKPEPQARGLFLYGNNGTGKTLFAQLVLRKWRYLECKRIVALYKELGGFCERLEEVCNGGYLSSNSMWPPRDVVIDELTGEPICVDHGQREEVMAGVISDRYRAWSEHNCATVIICNVDVSSRPQVITERYGNRTADRLREMCDFVKFDGKSARGR